MKYQIARLGNRPSDRRYVRSGWSLNTKMAAFIFSVAIARGATPSSVPFGDSFEGAQIYPAWALTQQFGSVSLSNQQAYSGAHSLEFASSPGGNRQMMATYKLPTRSKGTVSVAFYDTAPGQETLYEQLEVSDSTISGHNSAVGTQDFDANCYMAYVANGTMGPNANCGIYPQLETTPVVRTPGWHILSITYGKSTATIAIDGSPVFAASVNFAFDTVQIFISGPSWRPDTVAYFDNFSFIPLTD
jgi:hypothetical protein